MKTTLLFSLLFCSLFATAQNFAAVEMREYGPVWTTTAPAPAPAPGNSYLSRRRERTLLGDLDLSGIWGGPTYNYTATGNDWSLVRGGFGGLEFGENVFLGYGGWSSRDRFTTDAAPVSGNRVDYNFRQGGFILAVSPGRDNVVHPRFTAIVGPGRIELEDGRKDRMLVGQLMGGAELNLFQWFRLGIEGGYRFASGVDEFPAVTSKDVSGAVVQIEARFGWSW